MIVVASKTQVFGPFVDANQALRWIACAISMQPTTDLPLVIQTVVDPDRFGKQWRLSPFDGHPTTGVVNVRKPD